MTPEPTEGLIPSPDETITPEPTEGLIPSPDETITPELTDTPSVEPTATPGQPDTSEPTATVTPVGGDGYEIGERDDNGETTHKNDKDEQSTDNNGPIWIAVITGGAVLAVGLLWVLLRRRKQDEESQDNT